MTISSKHGTPSPRIDPAELFKKLGLTVADERPIMDAWREANALWRRERAGQVAHHAQRIREHRRRYARAAKQKAAPAPGCRKAVWCVELRRKFDTMTAAANFVGKNASNISQSLKRGVRCGSYHWEAFDPGRHKG